MLLPRQIRHHRRWVLRFRRDHHVAGAGETVVRRAGVLHLLNRPAHELIDVARVVGEQHKRLEVFYRGAGVVTQARQGEIGA